MARRTKINEYPFTSGEHQEIDGKILPDGFLTRAKNVRLRKDGRFGVRADFDALGNDTANSADIVPYDLMVGHGRELLALANGSGVANDDGPRDLAQYVGAASGVDWRTTVQNGAGLTVGLVTEVRDLAALPTLTGGAPRDVSRIDCAAAGGLVAVAMQIRTTPSPRHVFQVLRADSGATVATFDSSGSRPRVVAVGSVFFFLSITLAGSDIVCSRFDPVSDSAITIVGSVANAAAFNCYDAATNAAGTGFWLATNSTAPATSIIPVNSAGVAGTPITGPAVTYQHVAVYETATRIHLASVIAAGATQLRSYTTGGVLSSGPTTLEATTNDRQPGMVARTSLGVEQVIVVTEATLAPLVGSVRKYIVTATTHAIVSSSPVDHAYLGSKPAPDPIASLWQFVGHLKPDGLFLSHQLSRATTRTTFINKDRFTAAASSPDTTPQIAHDASTGRFYWPHLYLGPDGNTWAHVTGFTVAGDARRQSATIGGLSYIASGLVQIYDGQTLADAGFFEKPAIISAVASNGAGSLPSNTTLLVAVVYELVDRRGNIWTSDVSTVSTVTMGASDDTITLTLVNPTGEKHGDFTITVAAYRSVAGVNQLRRAETTVVDSSASTLTLTLTAPDSTVRANGVIYTQAGRGILSGTLPHEAPQPCDYIWKFGARLLCASADRAFVSKEVFPGEPVNFSGDVGFSIPSIPERIVGVAALDLRGFLFTSERIYVFVGDGPNDNGEGRYSEPVALPSSTGLTDWRSLVETPLGIMFQGSNGQIWLLPRDGSAPVWIGEPVRDTLVAFPVVTSATLCTEEQLVSFTCNNAGETDSRIVNYDLRAKAWIVDEFASATPIKAACSYQGRLAYLSNGIVYVERTSLTPGTFIEHGLTTGTINEFGSGWGKYVMEGLVGEYRGDCNLRARISYDDGKTFVNMAEFPLLASGGLAVGDTIEREWAPARRKAQGIRLEFMARTAGSASEGFVFNNWWSETQGTGGGPRKRASERG